ncbi:MAG: 23S rRNA (pseudouridine(1915)-N(3))-methyltransferase RlmH [Clostridia bacterium]
MKINVIAIGKIKEKYFEDAILEYAKRMSKFADFNIVELADAPPGKTACEQQKIEGARLLAAAKGYIIALDGGGVELSSEGFSQLIASKCNEGFSEFSFLIGGSHGHGQEVKDKANMKLSFSKMTFPHQLFRVVLCEQIYRAMTIIAGTPYHK